MASSIDILGVGYAEWLKCDSKTEQDGEKTGEKDEFKYMKASGSCCLVRSNRTNILFDCMGPWEKDLLLDRLAKVGLHPDDIEYLVCSHSHPDHVGNLNLFTKAKIHFVGTLVYSSDVYQFNCFQPLGNYKYLSSRPNSIEVNVIKYQNYPIDANIVIEPTPGHTMECVSLMINNCENFGTVVLAGDLFENEADVTDEGIWLEAGSQNPDLQRASRSRVYNKVDYILPGHGPLFKTMGPMNF